MLNTDLVEVCNGEPVTTSLAIAEGTEVLHKNVLGLLKKYREELQEFGSLAFETRVMRLDGFGGQPAQIAFLNEQQATLLLTFMRNTEIVINFKVRLVKAFFQMRDLLTQPVQPETTLPPSVGHRADHIVSASRCFNGLMRVASALKLPHGRAVQSAMESAKRHTGVDLMAELGVTTEDLAPVADRRQGRLTCSHFPEEAQIVAWLSAPAQAGRNQFSNEEILSGALGCTARQVKDRSKRTRVGHIMSRLGWYHSRQRNYSGPNREQIVVYSRPPI